mgnify:CR=1 FL=1
MSLVTSDWLENNLDKVKLIDCSWHMPNVKRNGYEEYLKEHIPGTIFFDLDKYSDANTDLPHMLPNPTTWEEIVSSLGISNNDRIIIYDNSDVLSSCRCWYNFIYFGHNQNLVHVLNGGLKKWISENRLTTKNLTKIIKSNYRAFEKKELVKNKLEIDKNISTKKFNVIDARSIERFEGKITEPRKGLRSGSIKNSFCLPFTDLLNSDRTFISNDKILEKFKAIKCDLNKNLIFTCGSGITASVLALAYSLIDNKYMPTIYDGSWSEYGKF